MGGLFGGGGNKGPGPEYYASLARQEENLKKREKDLEEKERDQEKKLAAQKKAKQYGGFQLLLSPDRDAAEQGLEDELSDTLGNAPAGAATTNTTRKATT